MRGLHQRPGFGAVVVLVAVGLGLAVGVGWAFTSSRDDAAGVETDQASPLSPATPSATTIRGWSSSESDCPSVVRENHGTSERVGMVSELVICVPGRDSVPLVLGPQDPGWSDLLSALGAKTVGVRPSCPEPNAKQLRHDFGFIVEGPDGIFAVQRPSTACGYYGTSIYAALETTGHFDFGIDPGIDPGN